MDTSPTSRRVVDAETLRALAHPLRLRLLGLLRTSGPSTATRLAAACGESSALTSYHLRRLSAVAMIIPATEEDLGERERHGRDRWWKAAERITVSHAPPEGEDDAIAATTEYLRAITEIYAERAREWLDAQDRLPAVWRESTTFGDDQFSMTAEQTRVLGTEIAALIERHRLAAAEHPSPDAVPVTLEYLVFPAAEHLNNNGDPRE